jgi:prepilin-type N-terminal cleavage/methylation domain-containing protein
MRLNGGFTLLELITTIAVSSILMLVAVPSFNSTLRTNCAVTGANSLLTKLTLARSEAIKRSQSVSMCKSNDGATCVRGGPVDWSQGFIMFEDDNNNGALDAGEKIIVAESTPNACCAISANKYSDYIHFNSEGIVNSNGSFFVTANSASDVNRTVAVFRGRVRVCSHQTDKSCPAPS